MNIVALAAIAAGTVALWQPRHFRLAVGIFLLIFGVEESGFLHF